MNLEQSCRKLVKSWNVWRKNDVQMPTPEMLDAISDIADEIRRCDKLKKSAV